MRRQGRRDLGWYERNEENYKICVSSSGDGIMYIVYSRRV